MLTNQIKLTVAILVVIGDVPFGVTISVNDDCVDVDPRPGSEDWLPIDQALVSLASRQRAPKLLPLRELGTRIPMLRGGGSIHAWARRLLHFAFQDIAYSDPSSWKVVRDQAKAFLRDTLAMSEAIATFLDNYEMGIPTFGDGQSQSTKASRNSFSIQLEQHLKRCGADLSLMQRWAWERLDDISPEHGGRPKLKWKEEFVTSLADAWYALTDSMPSPKPNGHFADFVDAAWRSGGTHLPELSWERAIRNGCKIFRAAQAGDETSGPGI